MIDTISQTTTDSLSFYLKREVVQEPDSFRIGFSQYEYFPTDSNRLLFDPKSIDAVIAQPVNPQGFAGDLLPFSTDLRSILFLLLLASFAITAVLVSTVGPSLVTNYMNLIVNRNRNRSAFKSQITTAEAWSEVFIVFQTFLIITISIFYFVSIQTRVSASVFDNLKIFFGIFFAISLLVIGKYMVYKILTSIFKEFGLGEWPTMYMRYIEILGLLLFLPTVFFLFLPEFQQTILLLQIVIFFTTKILSFVSLLNIFVKNSVGLLYYFLYLCAIEIAPYFLIYKGVASIFM